MKSKFCVLLAALICCAAQTLTAQFLPEKIIAGSEISFNHLQPADINSDGHPDLVCIKSGYNRVILWYLNDGAGHFPANPSDSIQLNISTNTIVVADFNGDAVNDIAVADDNESLFWYAGNGQGQFIKQTFNYSNGLQIAQVEAADMDMDGDQDLVLTEYNFPVMFLRWLANDGNGNFSDPNMFNDQIVIESLPFYICDLGGGGSPDILLPGQKTWYANYSGSLYVETLPEGVQNLFGIADANGDGYPDIFTFNSTGSLVLFGYNINPNGSGISSLESPTVGGQVNNSYVGDYDGDGDPDIIQNYELHQQFIENDGFGSFTYNSEMSSYNLYGQSSFPLSSIDLNADGREELLIDESYGIIEISLSDDDLITIDEIVPDILEPALVKPMDFDGDGNLDVVLANLNNLFWLPNDGAGHFGKKQYITKLPFLTTSIQFADIDGDGDQDITMQPYSYPQTLQPSYLLRNLGFGVYANPVVIPINGPAPLLLLDFDADGDTDIIGGAPLQFGKNIGNGNFANPVPLTTCYAGTPAAIDMDGDGDLDIAVPCDVGVTVLQNDGAANFSVFQEMSMPVSPRKCWWADLDGSGKMDVVVSSDSAISWFSRRSDGTFGAWRQIYKKADFGISPQICNLTDYDGDGDVDIVVPVLNVISVLKNDGTGVFSIPNQSLSATSIADLITIDADGDHDQDLVYTRNQIIAWLENVSDQAYFSGTCYLDYNENKQRDPGEPLAQNQIVRLEPAGRLTFTDADGRFRLYADSGHVTLSVIPDSCWTLSTDSAAYHLYFDGINTQNNLDFGLKGAGTEKKLAAHIASAPTRCGFEVPAYVALRNEGCAIASSVFELYLDSLVTFISADPAPYAVAGNQYDWHFADTLQPGDTRYIQLVLKIAGTEHLGDTIQLLGITRALDQAGNPENRADSSFLISRINCSYDPNDKLVNRAQLPEIYEVANSELVYTIRFQNTGTDTAFNITVRDRLAPELDLSTFRPFGASHPYAVTLDSATRTAAFSFKNILLPDSNINERASHGMLQFGIRPLAHLPGGTNIENQAGIYFDFNPPVVTNIAETRVLQTPVSTWQPITKKSPIQLWPNPSTGEVLLAWKTPIPAKGGRLILSDLAGRTLRETNLPPFATNIRLDVQDLAPGLYFIRLSAENLATQAVKLIKSN